MINSDDPVEVQVTVDNKRARVSSASSVGGVRKGSRRHLHPSSFCWHPTPVIHRLFVPGPYLFDLYY